MKIKQNKILKIIFSFFLLGVLLLLSVNFYVIISVKNRIILEEDIHDLKDIDAIIVLGAAPWGNEPSPMLEDRLLTSISLYENKVSSKIIMSGDHIHDQYNEVGVMKNYAIHKGISSSDIFMDHAGISTYDSIKRAKEIFGLKKIVIVTQEYSFISGFVYC